MLFGERPVHSGVEGTEHVAQTVALLDISQRFEERRLLQTYSCLHVGGGSSFRTAYRDESSVAWKMLNHL
jgi:hypothetical protein